MPCWCSFNCGGLCSVVVSLLQSMPFALSALPLAILKVGNRIPLLGRVWKRTHLDASDDGCTHEGH